MTSVAVTVSCRQHGRPVRFLLARLRRGRENRQFPENEDQLPITAGQVSARYIALYKALGGGWEIYPAVINRRAPPPSITMLPPPGAVEQIPLPPVQ